jgi:hypothetical protein
MNKHLAKETIFFGELAEKSPKFLIGTRKPMVSTKESTKVGMKNK